MIIAIKFIEKQKHCMLKPTQRCSYPFIETYHVMIIL